jgi:hypothetical protein
VSGVCAVPESWTTISEALTVIDGVFDATAAGGIVFHAAGLDAPAVAAVQACVRRRLLCILKFALDNARKHIRYYTHTEGCR